MKRIISVTLALLSFNGFTARSTDVPPGASLVKTIQWQAEKLPPEVKLNGGGPDGTGSIAAANAAQKPASISLWESNQPGIQTKWYALRGKIRYRGVEGIGYLDLWSSFSGESPGEKARYFSRTLANRGPLQQITGTSDWREVLLPFDGTQAKAPPGGLELNLVLPGPGAVDITDLQLLQFADAASMWAALGSGAGGPVNGSRLEGIPGLAAGSIILAAAAIVFFIRRRKRDELRRMRALDLA